MYYEVGYKAVKRNEEKGDIKLKGTFFANALNFGMAEKMAFEELEKMGGITNCDVVAVKRSNAGDVVESVLEADDKYFKAKIIYEYLNEKGNVKKENHYVLIAAVDHITAADYALTWAHSEFGDDAYVNDTALTDVTEVLERMGNMPEMKIVNE